MEGYEESATMKLLTPEALDYTNLYKEGVLPRAPWMSDWKTENDAVGFSLTLLDVMKNFKFSNFTIGLSESSIVAWSEEFSDDWKRLMKLCPDETKCGIVYLKGHQLELIVRVEWDRTTAEGNRFFTNFIEFNKFLDVLILGTSIIKHDVKERKMELVQALLSTEVTHHSEAIASCSMSIVKLAYFRCVLEHASHIRAQKKGTSDLVDKLEKLSADVSTLTKIVSEEKAKKSAKKKVY